MLVLLCYINLSDDFKVFGATVSYNASIIIGAELAVLYRSTFYLYILSYIMHTIAVLMCYYKSK